VVRARRQANSLKIPSSAVYGGGVGLAGGGSGAGAAGTGVSMDAAGSGEPGELAGRGSGGPVDAPVAWACRGCAGSAERGELVTSGGGGSMVPAGQRDGEAGERKQSRRRGGEEWSRKCPLTGKVLPCSIVLC
jgi:hypothetical protein